MNMPNFIVRLRTYKFNTRMRCRTPAQYSEQDEATRESFTGIPPSMVKGMWLAVVMACIVVGTYSSLKYIIQPLFPVGLPIAKGVSLMPNDSVQFQNPLYCNKTEFDLKIEPFFLTGDNHPITSPALGEVSQYETLID